MYTIRTKMFSLNYFPLNAKRKTYIMSGNLRRVSGECTHRVHTGKTQ